MWESIYCPAAEQCGMLLSYKSWKDCMAAGLYNVAVIYKGCDPVTLTCGRSARHSNFGECNECQGRRKAWLEAARSPGSDPRVVKALYQAVLDHNKQWSEDRAEALRTRQRCYHKQSDAIYQCDDKCGSHWESIPVDSSGRNSKANMYRLFNFSIQANVICGMGKS
jgi:hypothetical protein